MRAYWSSLEDCFHGFSLSHRQCALVALHDVKAYLTKEGGQIAVSSLRVLCGSVDVRLMAATAPTYNLTTRDLTTSLWRNWFDNYVSDVKWSLCPPVSQRWLISKSFKMSRNTSGIWTALILNCPIEHPHYTWECFDLFFLLCVPFIRCLMQQTQQENGETSS